MCVCVCVCVCMYVYMHLDRLQNTYTNYKGINNSTISGQITGIP